MTHTSGDRPPRRRRLAIQASNRAYNIQMARGTISLHGPMPRDPDALTLILPRLEAGDSIRLALGEERVDITSVEHTRRLLVVAPASVRITRILA